MNILEYQDDTFRADVKVLAICRTLEEARSEREEFERKGFGLLNIWEVKEVS